MSKKKIFAVSMFLVLGFVYASMANGPYDRTNFNADGRKWQPIPTGHVVGKDNGPGVGTHNAGEDCGICHRADNGATKGKAKDFLFTMAGTIYEDRAARKPFVGAEVILEDIDGNVLSMTTNEVGNFWTFSPIASNPCAVANHGGTTDILYTLDGGGSCVPNDPTGADTRAWQYKAWVKHGDSVRRMVSIVPVGGATDPTSRMSCNMHHSPLGSSGGVWASSKTALRSYPDTGLSFKKHILPIFRSKCVPCHIPGARLTRTATKTDLDTPSTAIDYSAGKDFSSYAGSTYTTTVGGVSTPVVKPGVRDFSLPFQADPDSSPLLAKTRMNPPGSGVEHAGGEFWPTQHEDYKAIRQWIAEGALDN